MGLCAGSIISMQCYPHRLFCCRGPNHKPAVNVAGCYRNRFGSEHIDRSSNSTTIRTDLLAAVGAEESPQWGSDLTMLSLRSANHVSKSVQEQLRKKVYPFPRAQALVQQQTAARVAAKCATQKIASITAGGEFQRNVPPTSVSREPTTTEEMGTAEAQLEAGLAELAGVLPEQDVAAIRDLINKPRPSEVKSSNIVCAVYY
eukprot:SAG31_NODE_1419_length_8430_cov_2.658024_3_plen_202_part_00